jgi:Tfp pilus assembly protein PilF
VFSANPRLDQKQLCFLADALLNLGEMRKAAAVLERAAEHQPLTPFGRFLLAQAYLQTDEFAKAQTHFEAVLAADPKAINAHYGLATVYARLGQVTAAQRHKDIYAQLRQGELAESARLRPEMRKADWADPRPVVRECYLNAGKLYLTSNQPEEAEQHWLRAAEIDPQDVRPRQLLAALYQALGRREAALRLAKDLPPAP